MLAIIGGTGLANLANLAITHRQVVRTPYGEPSGPVTIGDLNGHPVMFLARHGYGHTIPPHQVNYRANLWAMREMGAGEVLAVASVGAVNAAVRAGEFVVPDQLIDYTWGRKHTFQDGQEQPVAHMDFTEPYAARMRRLCLDACARAGVAARDGGTYAVTQGPRFETAAEVRRLARDGADVVGMTGMPEAALARELGLAYATLAVVTNDAAGAGASAAGISPDAIRGVLQSATARVLLVLEALVLLHRD